MRTLSRSAGMARAAWAPSPWLERLRRGWLAPRGPRAMSSALTALLVLATVLRLNVIATSTGAAFDIQSFAIQAATVFNHQNIYAVTTRYPYPPVWVWIAAAMKLLATASALPFDQVVKLPALLGDLGIIVVLARYARARLGPCWAALVPAALYALDPVALLISAGHGQFDSPTILFILLAIYLRGPEQARRPLWAAAALGVGIALKGYPVLALPYLVLTAPRDQRLRSAIVALLPLLLSIGIYCLIFGYSANMPQQVLSYQSTFDGGWSYLLLQLRPIPPVVVFTRLADVSEVAIILFALVVPAWAFRRDGATAVMVIYAAFYAFTTRMGVQYMLWGLPFLCLAAPLWATVAYSASAFTALAGFYAALVPGALPVTPVWQALLAPVEPRRTIGVAGVILVSWLVLLVALAPVLRQVGRTAHVSLRRGRVAGGEVGMVLDVAARQHSAVTSESER